MEYTDSIEKSAEYLRMALPLMSKQAAGLHPVSYAVWYEYVSGRNPELKARIDDAIKTGSVFTEDNVHELFRKHIAEVDQTLAKRVTEGFNKVMADMSQSASQANDQADQVGSVLDRLSENLTEAPSSEALDLGMEMLRQQTQNMQGAVTTLKDRLDESRREIEQLRQEVAKAREDALADGLTGLVNRRGFDMALSARLSAEETAEAGTSLLLVDIDFFKRVNDTYGHLFGDKVIRAVAQILKDNVKGKDTAARYGGEEFCVLLPDTTLDGASHLAEKIRATVEKCRIRRSDNQEAVASITVSVGATCFRKGESSTEFVARADAALYKSKSDGRNRITLAK